MNLTASCALSNATQPNLTLRLKVKDYVAVTYGCHLRAGNFGEDPHTDLRGMPDKVLIEPERRGHKLTLNMTHGRDKVDQEMDDFGYCAHKVEGHVPPPKGDVILMVKEGVKIINYHTTGPGWDELLIPYEGDMLRYEGRFYGDWSADNEEVTQDALLC